MFRHVIDRVWSTGYRRWALILLMLSLAFGAVLRLASEGSGAQLPAGMKSYFPNVVLRTHDGRTVRFYDDLVKDRTVLINFMFTTCATLCPLTTANLVKVQAALGDRVGRDIFLYSITLDPGVDTPDVLRRYREAFGVKGGWTFLTGRPDEITLLRRKLGAYDPDPVIDADKTQHASLVVYGNDRTGRWGTIPGADKPERIVKAVLRVAGRQTDSPLPASGPAPIRY